MNFSIDAGEGTRKGCVPSLILQPLIENAVKHGLNRSIETTDILIHARRNEGRLVIAVENDVNGRPRSDDQEPKGFGIGLRNVAERIHARFGENGHFRAGMTNNMRFRAEIDIPWQAV